jgi:hypothetical protein
VSMLVYIEMASAVKRRWRPGGRLRIASCARRFEVASQRRGDLLEVVVNPDAKTIEEASRIGNDGPGLKGGLVDLHEEVKVRMGVFYCGGIILEVFVLIFKKEIAIAGKPGREKVYVLRLELRSLVSSEGSICGSVGEVIAHGKANVGVAFDESWAQVFITVNDKEVTVWLRRYSRACR